MKDNLPLFSHVMVSYTDGTHDFRQESDTMSVNGVDYPILAPSDYWIGPKTVLMLVIDKETNNIVEANLAIGLQCEQRVPPQPPQTITVEFTAIPWSSHE